MARLALAFMAAMVCYGIANNGFAVPDALEDKLWLVAIFPAVYLLGVSLLKD